MKILLTLILCSGLSQECIEPYEWPVLFDNNYECIQEGAKQSYLKILGIGDEVVNETYAYVMYDCSLDTRLNT